jgi:signal transduction histidine kinase
MPALRATPGATSTFPVVVALEALDEWLADPTPERRVWLGESLAAVVQGAGARGAFLELIGDPLPAFATGYGTLKERPGDDTQAVAYTLRARDGSTSLARLWLDAAEADADLIVRALEIALEAAWALASERRAGQRLAALDEATRAIAGVLELDAVLQLIVERVCELAGATYAALGIVDRYGGIERFITTGLTPEVREQIGSPPRGHGLLGLIIREGQSYRIPDIAAHPDSYGFPPHHPPMRSFLGVPVVVKGRTIGNLYLTDKRDAAEFDPSDQLMVELFARHAGIAIENARLLDQVQRLAVVEERDRIGQELHDGIIQGLYAVTLTLEDVEETMAEDPDQAAARIDRSIDAVHEAIRDIRNFVLGLRPHLLERTDLVGGLAALAEEMRLNTMVDMEVDLDEGIEVAASIDEGHRAQLMQIAREALSNAARHSRASRARLVLGLDDDRILRLAIEDNGVGFEVAAARGGEHQGLVNMRDRATHMGGQLEIDSAPGSGTRIIVRVPLSTGERNP